MKVNKKQIIMLALSLVVCVAVYLNWRFLQSDTLNNITQTGADVVEQQTSPETENTTEKEEGKTLGEAQYVSSTATDINEYFTNSRLTRQQSKDKAIELLETVINNESSSEASVEKASMEISEIAAQTELEGTVESLIKAKGFNDCVVFLSSDIANIVVQSEGLTAQQAAQISEIVVSHTGFPASSVKIVEVK